MAAPRHKIRTILLLIVVGLACLIGVGIAVTALRAGAATEVTAPSPTPAERPAAAAEMAAAASRAGVALRARDHAAWDAALPCAGEVRRSVDSIYRHVAPLPWSAVRLVSEPVVGQPGLFYLGVVGELGGADPADRIVARRVYQAAVRGGRLELTADVTPRDVRGQQVMAFERPVALRGNGLVVISEGDERAAARRIVRAGLPARERLELLGITSHEPVVVYYYASRRQLLRSLGEDPGEPRIRFFSHPPIQVGSTPTWTRDVGVLGPALAGTEAWAPHMLAHELTHAFTSDWFSGTNHAPSLLAEGLATAVEGGRSFAPLRRALASGAATFPLEKALRARSLWEGNRIAKIRLAYLEGASLVLYVLHRWDLRRLRLFVRAVSDSDLTVGGLDAASRASVGLRWEDLCAGWEDYVASLP